jgi:uncharacterized protein
MRSGIAALSLFCLNTAMTPDSLADAPIAASAAELSSNVPLLETLAAQGNAVAQFNLGVLHDTGRGVWQDYKLAAQWYRKAAMQGHAAAQFNLGGLYYEGQGVPKDLVRASVWFTLAAIAGYDGASRNRNSVATLLTADQISTVQQMARACRLNNYVECD